MSAAGGGAQQRSRSVDCHDRAGRQRRRPAFYRLDRGRCRKAQFRRSSSCHDQSFGAGPPPSRTGLGAGMPLGSHRGPVATAYPRRLCHPQRPRLGLRLSEFTSHAPEKRPKVARDRKPSDWWDADSALSRNALQHAGRQYADALVRGLTGWVQVLVAATRPKCLHCLKLAALFSSPPIPPPR
jgi:hypothetical protein